MKGVRGEFSARAMLRQEQSEQWTVVSGRWTVRGERTVDGG